MMQLMAASIMLAWGKIESLQPSNSPMRKQCPSGFKGVLDIQSGVLAYFSFLLSYGVGPKYPIAWPSITTSLCWFVQYVASV